MCTSGSRGPGDFYRAATSLAPHVTDKVHFDGKGHHYELIYGIFLIPLLEATEGGGGLRLFEIGLGCDYGGKLSAGERNTQAKSPRTGRGGIRGPCGGGVCQIVQTLCRKGSDDAYARGEVYEYTEGVPSRRRQ